MGDDSERLDEEHEGGPVKSFLEHLEDLRWVLIKSAATLGVAMLICLIAGNYVMQILKWPLTRARVRHPGTNQVVTVRIGTNQLGIYHLPPEVQQKFALSTNRFVTVEVEPTTIGTNRVLSWNVSPDPNAARNAQQLSVELVNLSPAGGFVVAFQAAFYGGMVLAGPFIFFFAASFIFPALKRQERTYVFQGLWYGVGLFMAGVAFCYFILMPLALSASQMYSHWLGLGAYQWRAEEYISFVCKFMLGMGLGFELPVIILTLVKIGALSYSTLSKARHYMIVVNLLLGAVLTTPEVITQVSMFIPLQILYEISVGIAWYWEQPDRVKARRRLVFVLIGVFLVVTALIAAYLYAWPLLRGN